MKRVGDASFSRPGSCGVLPSTVYFSATARGLIACRAPTSNGYFSRRGVPTTTRLSNQKIKLDGTSYNYGYSYDAATGQVATVSYPSGFVAEYDYTALGYLSQVKDHISGASL